MVLTYIKHTKSSHIPDDKASINTFFFFGLLVSFGPHLRHMEVPRIGAELELQLPAYTRKENENVCKRHKQKSFRARPCSQKSTTDSPPENSKSMTGLRHLNTNDTLLLTRTYIKLSN